MAEDNEFSVEANEAEMVAEGGAVQESTDPEVTEADATENTADAPDTTELQSEEMVAEGDVSESDAKDEPAADPEAALAAEPEESADAEYKARLRKYTRELKKLPGQWYICLLYTSDAADDIALV